MIDISTLTIGSHVLLIDNEIAPGIAYLEKGVRYKVTGIDSFNNLISLGDKCEERYGIKHALSFNPDHFDPIPITEELLTELGFEKKKLDYGMYWVHEEIQIEECGKWWSVELDGNDFSVRYLHELEAFVYLTTKQHLI